MNYVYNRKMQKDTASEREMTLKNERSQVLKQCLAISTKEVGKITEQEELDVLMHENNDDLVGFSETWWDKACDKNTNSEEHDQQGRRNQDRENEID